MESQRGKEMERQQIYYEKWDISSKYTEYLMNNLKEKNDEFLYDLSLGIYKQFLSELKSRNIHSRKTDTVIQCWNTMIQTTLRNPSIYIKKQSIRLLHQTSLQRSYQHT